MDLIVSQGTAAAPADRHLDGAGFHSPARSFRHNGRVIRAAGTDLVDVERFRGYLERVNRLSERLFTPDELAACVGRPESLAARLAAKEAVLKALGSACAEQGIEAPQGWSYQEVEVTSAPGTAPRLELDGVVASTARDLGIGHWYLSLGHDGGMALAFVVAAA
ncbi:Holo-[acyl-carrier-protein] synthase [Actinomyces slackii]|uniref:Holo-[acyl-carrier-protein] synthase n=1 Tax=Actinomyces slackii TaxID=52774 RepID=A0A3S4SNW2_9ACTO|nr:Holo-[acyl-carrier-protein] synthase [Actinomyces slackii]